MAGTAPDDSEEGFEMENLLSTGSNNRDPTCSKNGHSAQRRKGGVALVKRNSSLYRRLASCLAVICAAFVVVTLCVSLLHSAFVTVKNSNNRGMDFRAPGELRSDWARQKAQSSLARDLVEWRQNCSLELRYTSFNDRAGLGANLHAYTFAMCLAHRLGYRLYSPRNWTYYDKEACQQAEKDGLVKQDRSSILGCYFSDLELQCPGDEASAREQFQSENAKDYDFDFWAKWKHKKKRNVCDSLLNRPEYKL